MVFGNSVYVLNPIGKGKEEYKVYVWRWGEGHLYKSTFLAKTQIVTQLMQ